MQRPVPQVTAASEGIVGRFANRHLSEFPKAGFELTGRYEAFGIVRNQHEFGGAALDCRK